MCADLAGYTFIPLFPEPWGEVSRQRLSRAINPGAPQPVRCISPPVSGIAFLTATGESSAVLDEWWQRHVPEGDVPVLLMSHQPGLCDWVQSLDATFVIGVASETDLPQYEDHSNVSVTLVRDGPVELSDYTIRLYGREGWNCFVHPAAAATVAAGLADSDGDHRAEAQPISMGPDEVPDPLLSLAAARPVIAADHRLAPEPVRQKVGRDWLVGYRPPATAAAPGAALETARHPGRAAMPSLIKRALGGLLNGHNGHNGAQGELAGLALAHTQGKIVSVVSLGGGVGKTSVAAAIGIIYGESVQDSGGSAAVVDQNVESPDQWGRLELDGHVRTVAEIMADIEAGREWSIPAWNRTPALAVYPERRGADGYPPAAIEQLARQLRRLHMMSVIDLPNCLPAFGPGRAGLAAGWLGVTDLVAIPTTDDPTRLQGVIELLDTPLIRGDAFHGHQPIPVVVAYVRSPLRAVRQDRGVMRSLDQIRDRVTQVVEIPKDERATLAIVRGQPITEINPPLRRAYVELSLAIARALTDT